LIFTFFCFARYNAKFAGGMTGMPKPKIFRRDIVFRLITSAGLLKSLNDNFFQLAM
jgi:hypothetical protein